MENSLYRIDVPHRESGGGLQIHRTLWGQNPNMALSRMAFGQQHKVQEVIPGGHLVQHDFQQIIVAMKYHLVLSLRYRLKVVNLDLRTGEQTVDQWFILGAQAAGPR